jgi:hypothetical protein
MVQQTKNHPVSGSLVGENSSLMSGPRRMARIVQANRWASNNGAVQQWCAKRNLTQLVGPCHGCPVAADNHTVGGVMVWGLFSWHTLGPWSLNNSGSGGKVWSDPVLQCIQKVFIPLDLFHILLSTAWIKKCMKYYTLPRNDKVKQNVHIHWKLNGHIYTPESIHVLSSSSVYFLS